MQKEKFLIAVVGPTAIGKTALGVEIAQHYNTEVISADSRQFYREMTIGTAKPTADEMQGVPHHFINNLSIEDHYTAGMFEQDAIAKLDEIFQTKDVAVVVGGSGLFVNALIDGLDEIPSSDEVRLALQIELETTGIRKLQAELEAIDPEYYAKADIFNPQRLLRAIEVYRVSGKPYSSYRTAQKKERAFTTIWIGLNTERSVVYNRINRRVDIMVEQGLIEEVKRLKKFKNLPTLKTVGYQELFDVLDQPEALKAGIELVKQNTRRFAKRQLTWFKRNESIEWFEPTDSKKVLQFIKKKMK